MTSSTLAEPWTLDAQQAVEAIRSGRLKAVDYVTALADTFADTYSHAIRVLRPQLQRRYTSIFDAAHLDALLFPTTALPAVDIVRVFYRP